MRVADDCEAKWLNTPLACLRTDDVDDTEIDTYRLGDQCGQASLAGERQELSSTLIYTLSHRSLYLIYWAPLLQGASETCLIDSE
jgi:hypothetical protein